VRWNFGPAAEALAPQLAFVYVNEKKRQARLADIQKGHELGLDLGEAFVRRELNLPEPEEGEAVIQGKRSFNPETTERNATAGMNPAREGGGARPFRGAIRGRPWID
jgi:phage gp29-like protein